MSRRKHELQTNDLIEYSTSAREFVARNLLVIILAAGVAVSAGVVIVLLVGRSREASASVWRDYLNARTAKRGFEVAAKFRDEHPDNPLARIASADGKLQELLFNGESDAGRALKVVGEAEELYRNAEGASDRYTRGQARLGLGAAAEFRAVYEPAKYAEHLNSAGARYDEVISEYKGDAAGLEAARRKARLGDYSDPIKLSRPSANFKPGPLASRELKDETGGHPLFTDPRLKRPDLPGRRDDPKTGKPAVKSPSSGNGKIEVPKLDLPDIGDLLPGKSDGKTPPPPPAKGDAKGSDVKGADVKGTEPKKVGLPLPE
jgi:hypothetical protein